MSWIDSNHLSFKITFALGKNEKLQGSRTHCSVAGACLLVDGSNGGSSNTYTSDHTTCRQGGWNKCVGKEGLIVRGSNGDVSFTIVNFSLKHLLYIPITSNIFNWKDRRRERILNSVCGIT